MTSTNEPSGVDATTAEVQAVVRGTFLCDGTHTRPCNHDMSAAASAETLDDGCRLIQLAPSSCIPFEFSLSLLSCFAIWTLCLDISLNPWVKTYGVDQFGTYSDTTS